MTQNPLVEQAKQGNINAIASLMNRLLKSQGMLANVERDGDRLEILIESDLRSLDDEVRIPKRDILVGMLKKWFVTLEIQNVSSIKISWQQAGESEPGWTEEIYLVEPVKDIAKPVELKLPPLPLPLPSKIQRDRQATKPAPIPDLEEMFGNPRPPEPPQLIDSLSAELDADLNAVLDSELNYSNAAELSELSELTNTSPSEDQDIVYFSDMPSGFDLSRMEQPKSDSFSSDSPSSEPPSTPSSFLLKTPSFSIQMIQYCVICAVIILGIRGLHALLGNSVKAAKTSMNTVTALSI
ncbi:MAG: hypothetical protein AUK48_03340 [Oscillatoriales cyanobacterium CG2_30_44_21]|nr:MAG: hypothetical protein AUK48_03340 [Oscillatoriales cyanobacterium CG2_30_44_21]